MSVESALPAGADPLRSNYRRLHSSIARGAPAASPADVCITAMQCSLQKQRDHRAPVSELAVLLHLAPDELEHLVQESQQQEALQSSTASADLEVYATLADTRLHHLFELWDLGNKGHLSFADVTLGLRRLCASAQKVYSTASDAAEVLLLYGTDGVPQLDRLQFAAFLGALCQGLGLAFQDVVDLLLVLAAVSPDAQDHMAALLSESAMEDAFAKAHPKPAAEEGSSEDSTPRGPSFDL